MPSRLSSLLVRDGLVGVKRMEKAFQRQVIYGASLDTIMLEMGLVPDERLTQYLSLASGLPPASRVETHVFDAEAVRRCPEDVAHKHRVVPLCLEGDALRVLVCDPVDMGLLEELADVIDLPIQPLIVPEYRWHVVFARAYNTTAPARFAALAKQIDAAPVTAPVGKARTVIIAEPGPGDSSSDHIVIDVPLSKGTLSPAALAAHGAVPLRPVGPEAATMRMAAVQPPAGLEEEAAALTAAVAAAQPAAIVEAAIAEPVHVAAALVAVAEPAPPDDAAPEPISDRDTEPTAPNAPRTRTQEMSVQAYSAHLEVTEVQRRGAEVRRRTSTPMPFSPSLAAVAEEEAGSPPADEPRDTEVMAAVEPEAAIAMSESIGVPEPIAPQHTPGDAVIRSPLSTGETPDAARTPMSPVVAREALQVAEDRDRIFMVLLRALRSRARWAGLLTVQGGAVIGRLAIAEPMVDVTQIAAILIPLDSPSAFRSAVMEQRPHVGPIATGDADIDGMLERLGGVVPAAALLLPIVLRDRVVALAIAHRMDAPIGLADVAELLPLGAVVADALGRLIVKHKAAGYRAPANPDTVVHVSVEDVATKRVERHKPASAWRIPTAPAEVPLEVGTEVTVTAEPARPVAELLDAIEAAEEGAIESAFGEAVERATELVPLLEARFPGKLRIDRYRVSGRALRAAQYGGLLELAVRIGPPVTDVLVEKMADTHRDVRFYATVCVAELRPRSAVYALVERLFDADYGVRAGAIEALAGYPLRDLDSALARARHALHSEDPERVLAAATAVAELGDVHAIPDLLDAVGRDGRRAEHARRALSALTKQDFGTSERKWRKWWDDHKARHRIEWLIEGLAHKDSPLRQSAAEDLRKLTGEHFGFHHDLPRRDRDLAQQRWQQWWQETGRRRFSREEDERSRATATLPRIT